MRFTQRAKALGLGAVALGAAVALAACGGGNGIENSGGSENVQTVKYQPPPSGDLTISQWPLYIDKETVPNFEKEYRILSAKERLLWLGVDPDSPEAQP